MTATRIAYRSTRGEGTFAKRRWTELEVHYDADALGGHRWIATARGCSDYPGEVTRATKLAADKLELALAHFDDSSPADIVREQARLWEQEARAAGMFIERPEFATDGEALAWLIGIPEGETGFASAAGRAFDVGESSIRMALRDGRPLRVPLLSLARFVDRGAFRSAYADKEGQS